jgi:hypothetical protein
MICSRNIHTNCKILLPAITRYLLMGRNTSENPEKVYAPHEFGKRSGEGTVAPGILQSIFRQGFDRHRHY